MTAIEILKKQRDFYHTNQTLSIKFRIEQLKKFRKILKSNEKLIDENAEEIKKISQKIQNCPDTEKVKKLFVKRERNKTALDDNLVSKGRIEENLTGLRKELEEKNDNLRKEMSKHQEQQNNLRILQFSEKTRQYIRRAEKKIMDDVRNTIQQKTFEIFSQLTWKKDTFSRINIDENYHIDLLHVDGYSCLGTCSAAERALLALSFTIALHEISGFDAHLVVDTPLSRVSDIHRELFAQVFKEICERKQIILLLTPSEYSSEIQKHLLEVATIMKIHTLGEKATIVDKEEVYK